MRLYYVTYHDKWTGEGIEYFRNKREALRGVSSLRANEDIEYVGLGRIEVGLRKDDVVAALNGAGERTPGGVELESFEPFARGEA